MARSGKRQRSEGQEQVPIGCSVRRAKKASLALLKRDSPTESSRKSSPSGTGNIRAPDDIDVEGLGPDVCQGTQAKATTDAATKGDEVAKVAKAAQAKAAKFAQAAPASEAAVEKDAVLKAPSAQPIKRTAADILTIDFLYNDPSIPLPAGAVPPLGSMFAVGSLSVIPPDEKFTTGCWSARPPVFQTTEIHAGGDFILLGACAL